MRHRHVCDESHNQNEMAAPAFDVQIVPFLKDNYGYLLIDKEKNIAGVVDPVDPEQALAAARQRGVEIVSILTTHHHWDHAGGNKDLKKNLPGIKIYGGRGDGVAGVTDEVGQGDIITIGQISIEVLQTPGHTRGHVCYYVKGSGTAHPGAVFTGDTMFVAGCGRLFEGTAMDMYSAIVGQLCKLPAETLVYAGHEYTVNNLRFAESVEPENQDIKAKLQWASECRAANKPTVPSTIHSELLTNPFARVDKLAAEKKIESKQDPVEVLAYLRALKDRW